MERIIVTPGHRLNGEVRASGSKNSALPILASTILTEDECRITRCPDISDVDNTVQILRYLGCEAEFSSGTVTVKADCIEKSDIPYSLMEQMRSSIIFLGAMLARLGRAEISMPGGCDLGPRPIDVHISSLKKMGAEFVEYGGFLYGEAQQLRGAYIHLPFPSVGATENIMLAAVTAVGETVISNAAKEPEIADLAQMLTKMGARIEGAGGDVIKIVGVKRLYGAEHEIIPDRIEAVTLIAAAMITGGKVTVTGIVPEHIKAVADVLETAGVRISAGESFVTADAPKRLKAVPRIVTAPYPGFPTDCQPMLTAMLSVADGVTLVSEQVFQSRFKYVNELYRMGADIYVEDRTAIVLGNSRLTGARVTATDLRAGAALVIAALASTGKTEIDDIYHIARGYENIDGKLRTLGADIKMK